MSRAVRFAPLALLLILIAGLIWRLATLTHAAEVMVSTVTYDIAERLTSLELLADAWFS